jgi:hypothetical protein
MLRISLLVAITVLLGACVIGASSRTGPDTMDKLRTKASFDLACDAAELRISCLQDNGYWCISAGVEGCEQRATYITVRQQGGPIQWLQDTRTSEIRATAP